MKKINVEVKSELKVKNIIGFFKKIVNPYGTGAKIDCPKQYLGKEVYVVVTKGKNKSWIEILFFLKIIYATPQIYKPFYFVTTI
mgnify:CR=1 FL=1